jgi:hypothetical protein
MLMSGVVVQVRAGMMVNIIALTQPTIRQMVGGIFVSSFILHILLLTYFGTQQSDALHSQHSVCCT